MMNILPVIFRLRLQTVCATNKGILNMWIIQSSKEEAQIGVFDSVCLERLSVCLGRSQRDPHESVLWFGSAVHLFLDSACCMFDTHDHFNTLLDVTYILQKMHKSPQGCQQWCVTVGVGVFARHIYFHTVIWRPHTEYNSRISPRNLHIFPLENSSDLKWKETWKLIIGVDSERKHAIQMQKLKRQITCNDDVHWLKCMRLKSSVVNYWAIDSHVGGVVSKLWF